MKWFGKQFAELTFLRTFEVEINYPENPKRTLILKKIAAFDNSNPNPETLQNPNLTYLYPNPNPIVKVNRQLYLNPNSNSSSYITSEIFQ